jgi:hypothetical protein
MREKKRLLHLHRVQSANGHMQFMSACLKLRRKLKRPLTALDRAFVRMQLSQPNSEL